jgi:hypothetical protein
MPARIPRQSRRAERAHLHAERRDRTRTGVRPDRRISHDGRDQRSSRCATSVPECERTERRIFAYLWWVGLEGRGAQILQFRARADSRTSRPGLLCMRYTAPEAISEIERICAPQLPVLGLCSLRWPRSFRVSPASWAQGAAPYSARHPCYAPRYIPLSASGSPSASGEPTDIARVSSSPARSRGRKVERW